MQWLESRTGDASGCQLCGAFGLKFPLSIRPTKTWDSCKEVKDALPKEMQFSAGATHQSNFPDP